MEEKLLFIKTQIEKMEELWNQKKNEAAFQLFTLHMSEINEFLLWMEQEQVLVQKDYQNLLNYLLQAIENKDSVLLQDVTRYVLLDIINQLLETDE